MVLTFININILWNYISNPLHNITQSRTQKPPHSVEVESISSHCVVYEYQYFTEGGGGTVGAWKVVRDR